MPIAAVLLAALLLLRTTAPAADCAEWRPVQVAPGIGDAGDMVLESVTAPTYGTAWAAGSRNGDPLLLRWTGFRWRAEQLPFKPGTLLAGVSAASAADAWTAGYDQDGTGRVAHWTGAGWRAVPLPETGRGFPRAVQARSTSDAWIVGSGGTRTAKATSWHWDGRSWRVVPIQDGSGVAGDLVAVSARTADDVWAVGTRGAFPPRPLVVHGDGRSWTPLPAAEPAGESELTGVAALARDDVWAVGSTSPDPAHGGVPLAEHWDGRAWRIVPVPGVDGRFAAVAADGHGGIWAAGARASGAPMCAHWTRLRWEFCHIPASGSGPGAPAEVWGLTRMPGMDYLWAVGSQRSPAGDGSTHTALTWTNGPRPR